jgi:protein TonB
MPAPREAAPPPTAQPAAQAPEPSTAPAALLAESGAAAGGIVQLPGASIGALATSKPFTAAFATPAPAHDPPRPASLARLSDLSRRPRAPSLDAALRRNYPAELRRRGIEGQAEVRVVVDRRGQIGEVAVVSESAAGFADACRKTLLGSRWSEPLDRDGRAVNTRLTYRCRFEIER